MNPPIGKIIITPHVHGRFVWKIKIAMNESRHDVTVSIDSEWTYLTRTTALSAARRWSKRLGVKLTNNDCPCYVDCVGRIARCSPMA